MRAARAPSTPRPCSTWSTRRAPARRAPGRRTRAPRPTAPPGRRGSARAGAARRRSASRRWPRAGSSSPATRSARRARGRLPLPRDRGPVVALEEPVERPGGAPVGGAQRPRQARRRGLVEPHRRPRVPDDVVLVGRRVPVRVVEVQPRAVRLLVADEPADRRRARNAGARRRSPTGSARAAPPRRTRPRAAAPAPVRRARRAPAGVVALLIERSSPGGAPVAPRAAAAPEARTTPSAAAGSAPAPGRAPRGATVPSRSTTSSRDPGSPGSTRKRASQSSPRTTRAPSPVAARPPGRSAAPGPGWTAPPR